MNHNTELARQNQLEALIPARLKDGYGKRMLYVGGHLRYGRNLQMSAFFRSAGYTIDVIEMPEVAIAAREDLVETRSRLAELLQWMGESLTA